MKIFTCFFWFLIGIHSSLQAQQQNASERPATVVLSELKQWESVQALKIRQYLAAHPAARQSYLDTKGNFCYLHRIDQAGNPVYYQTRSNLDLAKSINTNKLWSGGGLGLNLQGQNMEVSTSRSRLAVWEPGPTRTTHIEFEGRAITRDTPPFNTSMVSTTLVGATDHAAHVTGTMIAAGIRADARGMANQARIDCYETTNELSEQQTAASEGVLVSNHSYGPDFEKTSASKRGVYDEDAQNYDKIASNNRNYLQFHAAGNDRDDSQGISYDILLGGALAKNVVAIGAVQLLPNGYTGPSSVVMSGFSSFGPADDGRIKPDLVAPGVQITSAYSGSDNAYSTIDGTSMASPGAAGSMFLLQQHYKNTKNSFMKAATLKGLGIHTADEAGSADGPDYAFGWGLLNLEKAIKLINNSDNTQLLEETSLLNGETYRKQITTPGGAFKVTICWTDLPGTLLTSGTTNDRTPMLVNDLDVRLVDVATSQPVATLPWKLDPANPTAGATRGDNVVDNVEQIYAANLPAGNYYIQITHKGTLQMATTYPIGSSRVGMAAGSQDFSLLVTGVLPANQAPTVANVLAPQSATVGQAFSFVIPANTFTDADTPNSLTLSVTGLPTGLSFTAPATISGTPTTVTGSPFSLTVTATDPGGLSVSTNLTLTVQPEIIGGADLTPTLSLLQGDFTASGPGSIQNLTMTLSEQVGKATSGVIVLTLTAPLGYSLRFDPTLTSTNVTGSTTNPVSVNNANWEVRSLNLLQLTLVSKAGQRIGANGVSVIGLSLSRVSASVGSSNLTVNVNDDTTNGYDSNPANNIFVRILKAL